MKTVKILTIGALCASSLSPLAITPALAITLSGDTTTAMAGVCDADLAAKLTAPLHDGRPSLTVEVVETGQVDADPVESNRVETPGTRFGTGTPTYSGFTIEGMPFRTGGSVNLFGDKVAKNKNWPASEYDFTADYSTTTTVSYNCEYTRYSETHIPAVEGSPVQGYYIRDPEANGNVTAVETACARFTENGSAQPFWGEDQAQCLFIKTADAVDPVEEQWIDNAPEAAPELTSSQTVDETNTVYGVAGHEAAAGPWTEVGNWLTEKVVVCISPKKLPGIWTAQNGYVGTNCNTTYFNTAPWGGGSQTSNGTYISVPGA